MRASPRWCKCASMQTGPIEISVARQCKQTCRRRPGICCARVFSPQTQTMQHGCRTWPWNYVITRGVFWGGWHAAYPGTVAQEVQANPGSSHGSEHHQRTTTHSAKHRHKIALKSDSSVSSGSDKGLGEPYLLPSVEQALLLRGNIEDVLYFKP